jgi:hypothetical protein
MSNAYYANDDFDLIGSGMMATATSRGIFEMIVHGVMGVFLGGLTAVSALWYFDSINWTFVSICGGICGVLGFLVGGPFLHWLKELFWDT